MTWSSRFAREIIVRNHAIERVHHERSNFKFLDSNLPKTYFLTLPRPELWNNNSEFALIRGWTLVLYGTAISPQRDDEPRQSSSSPSSPNSSYGYSLNTLYRSGNYGSTNPYPTRNQPKSTTVPAQPATRKNGKQKNGKGNKNNQRTSTTPRPAYTTVMQNQSTASGAKSMKNKSKAGQSGNSSGVSFGKSTSTVRPPRITTPRTPNTKSQLNSAGGTKNNNLLPKVDKLEPANSNIYEKAPGKAPKQVKEGSYVVPTTAAQPTPNPSMSKMFERYEKIEQIYPELKPYKDNNPAYFTVTNGNGKPSRENSKSFSSFVSMNSAPQKKNSPSDGLPSVTRQQVTSHAAGEGSGKGTEHKSIYLFHPCNYFFVFSYTPISSVRSHSLKLSCVFVPLVEIKFAALLICCNKFIVSNYWIVHSSRPSTGPYGSDPKHIIVPCNQKASLLSAFLGKFCEENI